MKILVAFDGSDLSKRAVDLAIIHAKAFNAKVYVLHTILTDLPKKTYEQQKQNMENVKIVLEKENISCETLLTITNLMPGEHLIQFVEENKIDEIIIGVKMKSKVGKLLLGSISQQVILGASCPVVTIK